MATAASSVVDWCHGQMTGIVPMSFSAVVEDDDSSSEGGGGDAYSCAVELTAEDTSSLDRTLRTTRDVEVGQTLLRVPWPKVLTPRTALRCLRSEEARRKTTPVMTLDVDAMLDTFIYGDGVDADEAISLLLALQLLCELRNPKSRWQAYVNVLPAPRDSLVAACTEGAEADDLLLFSESELDFLQDPELKADVLAKRNRLTALHGLLCRAPTDTLPMQSSGNPNTHPLSPTYTVSLESFIWCHSLVHSRSMELTAEEGTDGGNWLQAKISDADPRAANMPLRVVIPVIDMVC
jgi:hypothetical protein